MKIAIHHRKGSFSERWVEYCQQHGIEYKLVNVYQPDIIEQVKGCNGFMWHHHHADYKDALFAKQLIYSLETAGIRCFPNAHTTWHFDDKVGQKYLLESVGAPLVPSYVFYTKKDALEWVRHTDFPKVFKLRGGAGSYNVALVPNKKNAVRLVKTAFGKGFALKYRTTSIKEHIRTWREGRTSIFQTLKSIAALYILPHPNVKMSHREKGYVYFQDYIPNNTYDIRICVVGDKAFGLKRLTREKDFRASGSGHIVYDKSQIDERCVQIAFETSKKLKTQSLAFDFVFDDSNEPLVVEISYAYAMKAYDKCEGYWDSMMIWHAGEGFDFCGWMVAGLINP